MIVCPQGTGGKGHRRYKETQAVAGVSSVAPAVFAAGVLPGPAFL
jgi:hypothetical protein